MQQYSPRTGAGLNLWCGAIMAQDQCVIRAAGAFDDIIAVNARAIKDAVGAARRLNPVIAASGKNRCPRRWGGDGVMAVAAIDRIDPFRMNDVQRTSGNARRSSPIQVNDIICGNRRSVQFMPCRCSRGRCGRGQCVFSKSESKIRSVNIALARFGGTPDGFDPPSSQGYTSRPGSVITRTPQRPFKSSPRKAWVALDRLWRKRAFG